MQGQQEDIDIVILWVDGSDTNWLAEKNKYNIKKNVTDSSENRYRDWDNIVYLFRGIAKFAPWVRKVHFVTWGHLPKWLNTECKKLNIVNHTDFIPPQYLPTFNSHTIELNIHRIKGLANNFVYFNDDMFLINHTKSTDFFKNGLPCDEFVMDIIQETGIEHIVLNDVNLINHHFQKHDVIKKNLFKVFNFKYGLKNLKNFLLSPWKTISNFEMTHVPIPYSKETFIKLWNLEENKLNNTCESKFRYINDLNQYVLRYWQLCSGKFYPFSIHSYGKYFGIYDIETAEIASAQIVRQKYHTICVNDCLVDYSYFERVKMIINQAFEKILPEKSEFEI